MLNFKRPLIVLLLVLMACLPVQAQRIVHDPSPWIAQHTAGAPMQVTMIDPPGKVRKGYVISTGSDSFVLQPKRGFFGKPKPITLAYSDIKFAEDFRPVNGNDRAATILIVSLYAVLAATAITLGVLIGMKGAAL